MSDQVQGIREKIESQGIAFKDAKATPDQICSDISLAEATALLSHITNLELTGKELRQQAWQFIDVAGQPDYDGMGLAIDGFTSALAGTK